jgi:LysM repeat protein
MFKKLWVLLLAVPLSLMVAHTAYAGSYTVMANDSLYKIGRLFNTTASSIAKANNLSAKPYTGPGIKCTLQYLFGKKR